MSDSRRGFVRDLSLRLVGLVLLGGAWLLVGWLARAVALRHRHDPALVECAAAALGFLCASAGAALTTLGAHVFDEVEVSEQWARRYAPPRG